MPEGHLIHRLAARYLDRFEGHPVAASSPQGRFADGASRVDGLPMTGTDAHGKQLFLGFGELEGSRAVLSASARKLAEVPSMCGRGRVTGAWVRIHLGIYGKATFGPAPVPAPVGAVRLRLSNAAAYADLRGPAACELITTDEKQAAHDRLGPDPLRSDADPDRAWRAVSRSGRDIGSLLMDQQIVAGVGNIYRAEVLFRHRIDPCRAGRDLTRSEWDVIWSDLVGLMRDGVRLGRIDTVRPEHSPEAMGRPPRVDDHGGEVYVYRRAGQPCHVCAAEVRTAKRAGRNLFWCANCQPR